MPEPLPTTPFMGADLDRCEIEDCTDRAYAGGRNGSKRLCKTHWREWLRHDTPIPGRRTWWTSEQRQGYDKDVDAFGRAEPC